MGSAGRDAKPGEVGAPQDEPPSGATRLPLSLPHVRGPSSAAGSAAGSAVGSGAGSATGSTAVRALSRLKVSLAFQLGMKGDVMKRKKVLSFRAQDSLHRVYETISGKTGSPPLWPKNFQERVENGAVPCLLAARGGEVPNLSSAEAASLWQSAPPKAQLWELVRGASDGTVATLLLRLTEIHEADETALQHSLVPLARNARNEDGSPRVGGELKVDRTFLHFKNEDEEAVALSPRALSDPPLSHAGSMSEVASSMGEVGAAKQKQQKNYREYIERSLIPGLKRAGDTGEGSRATSTRGDNDSDHGGSERAGAGGSERAGYPPRASDPPRKGIRRINSFNAFPTWEALSDGPRSTCADSEPQRHHSESQEASTAKPSGPPRPLRAGAPPRPSSQLEDSDRREPEDRDATPAAGLESPARASAKTGPPRPPRAGAPPRPLAQTETTGGQESELVESLDESSCQPNTDDAQMPLTTDEIAQENDSEKEQKGAAVSMLHLDEGALQQMHAAVASAAAMPPPGAFYGQPGGAGGVQAPPTDDSASGGYYPPSSFAEQQLQHHDELPGYSSEGDEEADIPGYDYGGRDAAWQNLPPGLRPCPVGLSSEAALSFSFHGGHVGSDSLMDGNCGFSVGPPGQHSGMLGTKSSGKSQGFHGAIGGSQGGLTAGSVELAALLTGQNQQQSPWQAQGQPPHHHWNAALVPCGGGFLGDQFWNSPSGGSQPPAQPGHGSVAGSASGGGGGPWLGTGNAPPQGPLWVLPNGNAPHPVAARPQRESDFGNIVAAYSGLGQGQQGMPQHDRSAALQQENHRKARSKGGGQQNPWAQGKGIRKGVAHGGGFDHEAGVGTTANTLALLDQQALLQSHGFQRGPFGYPPGTMLPLPGLPGSPGMVPLGHLTKAATPGKIFARSQGGQGGQGSQGGQGGPGRALTDVQAPGDRRAPAPGAAMGIGMSPSFGLSCGTSFEGDDDSHSGRLQGTGGGCTAELFDAVTRNDLVAIQEILRDRGADVNESTEHGSHMIFRAVIKAQSTDMVHLLLTARADVRARDAKGNSVMHFWARATVGRNHLLDIGEALVRAGANVDAQRTTDGMSPLHHVAIGHNNRRGWLDFHKALFLLRRGADVCISTQRGQRPLDVLTKDGRTSTKKMMHLLQYGIDSAFGRWPKCEHPNCSWCW